VIWGTVAEYDTSGEWLKRLLHPARASASANTIEAFGWLLLAEGMAIFILPHSISSLLVLPNLSASALVYFRLVGLLIAGLGALYTISGRVNAQGFIFASFFDRPVVPLIMAVLWWNALIPATLAIAFSVQDFGSFLWTAWAWRSERRPG
jgi:hypothetical protein